MARSLVGTVAGAQKSVSHGGQFSAICETRSPIGQLLLSFGAALGGTAIAFGRRRLPSEFVACWIAFGMSPHLGQMEQMMKRATLFLCAALIGFGCGGEGTPSLSSVTKNIEATQGGNIALDGEETSVYFPKNALPKDTEIRLSTVAKGDFPALPSSLDRMLKIEPTGLVLEGSASVLLGLGGPIEEGQTFAVSQLVDGAWKQISAQLVSGGLVSTEITTLGTLALVVEDKKSPGAGNQIIATLAWGNEELIPDFPIGLYQGETKLTEKNTDAKGKVTFADLSAGEYTLKTGQNAECPVIKTAIVTNDAPTNVTMVMCSSGS